MKTQNYTLKKLDETFVKNWIDTLQKTNKKEMQLFCKKVYCSTQ